MAKRKNDSSVDLGNISADNSEVVPAKILKSCGSKSDGDLPSDWQSTRRKMSERLNFICNTEHYADIHFIVGFEDRKKRIPAHKLVLIIGSEVFGAMFSDNWASEKEIVITDVKADAFLILLKFLYTGTVELTMDSIFDVLYAAKKYAIDALVDACIDFLKKNVNASNVFTVLNEAKLFDEAPEVTETCLTVIDRDTRSMVLTDEFTTIDEITLSNILKRDTLTIDEIDLFEATLRWGDAECNRRELAINSKNRSLVLKNAMHLIRFPLMSLAEFTSRIAETKLLSSEDLLSLFIYFGKEKKSTINFVATPRKSSYLVVNRFLQIADEDFPCTGENKSFGFSVEKDSMLIGVGFYTSRAGASNYKVQLTIGSSGSYKEVISKSWDANDAYPTQANTFRLFFHHPVKLTKKNLYVVTFSIKGPDSLGGVNWKKHWNESICIRFHATLCDAYWKGFSGNGQLPELLFSQ